MTEGGEIAEHWHVVVWMSGSAVYRYCCPSKAVALDWLDVMVADGPEEEPEESRAINAAITDMGVRNKAAGDPVWCEDYVRVTASPGQEVPDGSAQG